MGVLALPGQVRPNKNVGLTEPRTVPRQWQTAGCWGPRPWLFGASAHRAEPLLTTSEVLGSSPLLFVHLLAGQSVAAASLARGPRPATGHQKVTQAPTPARVGTYSAGRGLRTVPVIRGGEKCSQTHPELKRELTVSQRGGEPAPEGQAAERGQKQREWLQKANASSGSGPQGLGRLWAAFTPRAEPGHYWGRRSEVGSMPHPVPPISRGV